MVGGRGPAFLLRACRECFRAKQPLRPAEAVLSSRAPRTYGLVPGVAATLASFTRRIAAAPGPSPTRLYMPRGMRPGFSVWRFSIAALAWRPAAITRSRDWRRPLSL